MSADAFNPFGPAPPGAPPPASLPAPTLPRAAPPSDAMKSLLAPRKAAFLLWSMTFASLSLHRDARPSLVPNHAVLLNINGRFSSGR
jgi:hypothetical protein